MECKQRGDKSGSAICTLKIKDGSGRIIESATVEVFSAPNGEIVANRVQGTSQEAIDKLSEFAIKNVKAISQLD